MRKWEITHKKKTKRGVRPRNKTPIGQKTYFPVIVFFFFISYGSIIGKGTHRDLLMFGTVLNVHSVLKGNKGLDLGTKVRGQVQCIHVGGHVKSSTSFLFLADIGSGGRLFCVTATLL